jgi:hypothetical protein
VLNNHWFENYLADTIQAAFRKWSEHSCSAFTIHRLIRDMDKAEWSGIVRFVSNSIVEGVEHRKVLAETQLTDQK